MRDRSQRGAGQSISFHESCRDDRSYEVVRTGYEDKPLWPTAFACGIQCQTRGVLPFTGLRASGGKRR